MGDEFIKRFNERDEMAFRIIFEALYASLVNWADTILKDRQESEDAVIISFSYVWRTNYTFNSYNHFKSAIFVIVKHRCFNVLKARKRGLKYTDIEDVDICDYSDEDYKDQLKRLHECIALLPERSRRLILLDLEDIPDKEISMKEGVKLESIHIRRHRAIELLKKLFKRNK